MSIKGGGHHIAGLAAADGGLIVEIKMKWKPGNLFRTNKNIAPQGDEPRGG